jgi:Phytanoyl-CoA dioxygenase (PhyH)
MLGLDAIKGVGARIAKAAGLHASAEQVLAKGRVLAAETRYLEAIDYVTSENERLGDPALERQLALWRCEAYAAIDHPPGRREWPPNLPDPFPGVEGAPEIRGADALNGERLGGAILHHGCLVVRGLLTPQEVATFVSGIDMALEAHARTEAGRGDAETERWYAPVPLEQGSRTHFSRIFAEETGCVLTADSPRNLAYLTAVVRSKGVDRAIEDYLGERPVLSIGKSTLRRVPPREFPGDWHQDGAFLGESIRTVNFWLCLSDCGEEASGLGMVRSRIPNVVETGTHGAAYDWSVGHGLAVELAQGRPIESPVFQPGDAVFFDQLFLHRTEGRPGLTKDRYAIESWFFAPSTYPTDWGPLVV